jgi:hypothetical protein
VITEAAALLRQLAELKPVATLRDDSEEELCWEQDAPMLPAGTPLYALPKEWTE